MKKVVDKLKKRWNVESLGGVVLILIIFALTGMTALYVRQFTFGWLGLNDQTPLWLEVIAWVAIIFPAYQILFLIYGFVLGQFEFVWNFEKKSFYRIKKLFVRNKR